MLQHWAIIAQLYYKLAHLKRLWILSDVVFSLPANQPVSLIKHKKK